MLCEWQSAAAAAAAAIDLFHGSRTTARGALLFCRFVIGAAVSSNGLQWRKLGPVYDPFSLGAQQGDHDELGAGHCYVERDIDNKQYLML